jgi:hypothetical protein
MGDEREAAGPDGRPENPRSVNIWRLRGPRGSGGELRPLVPMPCGQPPGAISWGEIEARSRFRGSTRTFYPGSDRCVRRDCGAEAHDRPVAARRDETPWLMRAGPGTSRVRIHRLRRPPDRGPEVHDRPVRVPSSGLGRLVGIRAAGATRPAEGDPHAQYPDSCGTSRPPLRSRPCGQAVAAVDSSQRRPIRSSRPQRTNLGFSLPRRRSLRNRSALLLNR